MVALTSWSYPLHSLVSQEQINSLISFSCQHVTSPSSGKTPGSLEWGQRAVQCLLIDILHHGEIKPFFESRNKSFKSKTDIFEAKASPASSPNKSPEEEKEEEDKLPPAEEQELKRMDQMFNKAPLEFPQILLSCGEVEIPLNRRTWKGRRGLEEMKKQAKKEQKKKLHEAQKKEGGSEHLPIHEEAERGGTAEDSKAKASLEEVKEKSTKETSSTKVKASLVPRDKEHRISKVKDVDTVAGINITDLKRYLRLTYLQGDFEHMVDFPPPEKHSYGVAMHNPLPASLVQPPYTSYIISNTFDYRVHSSLEVAAELELQQLAKKVYESVLHSLLHARPTPDPANETSSGEVSPVIIDKDALEEGSETEPFAVSTSMLTQAVEQLLVKALTPQSNLDLVSILEFCNDLNSLLPVYSPLVPRRYPKDYMTKQSSQDSSTSAFPHQQLGLQLAFGDKLVDDCNTPDAKFPFTVAAVSSKQIVTQLLNCLLKTQTLSSKMWQIGISILRTSLRHLWYFVSGKKAPVDIDYDLLLAVFMKLFSSRVDAVEIREANLSYLLHDIIVIKFDRGADIDEKWYGMHMLFELLVKMLDKRYKKVHVHVF